MTLRETGEAELYWNCKLIDTSIEAVGAFTYHEIYLNFDQIVMKRSGLTMFKQQHYVVLSLEKEQRTAFDDAKMTEMG